MRTRFQLSVLLAAVLFMGISAAPAHAQDLQELLRQAEQFLGRPVDTEEALRLLQQSGVSPEQVRQRLESEGFSRTAADPYLAVLEGRAARVPPGTNPLPLFQVLTGVDLASRLSEAQDTMPFQNRFLEGRLPLADTTPPEPPGPKVFGREMFRRSTSQFDPPRMGPVPPNYKVGPGDELVVVLTGDVEVAYSLVVSRDGWVVLPDVGRIAVNGLDLSQLRRVLGGRLSTVYSGLSEGPEATTFLEISLDNLRASQVYVIGDVEKPGAYEVGGLSTALTALYKAGGPTRTGSFRGVHVNRGGKTAATVDLYDYLLGGRTDSDVNLEQGDVVFVPVATRQVEVDGAVMRPGIYELAEGEGLGDLIRFAGGVAPDAFVGSVQVERILPAEQRRPGRHRVLLNLPAEDFLGEGPGARIVSGDRVIVFAVLEEERNTVSVSGGVFRPGIYGAEEGLRLSQLLQRAGGLLPDAVVARAQIQRMQADHTRRMISVSLERDAAGALVSDPLIEPEDQVFVFAARNLREARVVSIGGWVREPGVYPYVDGMTVRDLILRAGGLRTGAYLGAVDISRVVIAQAYGETITQNYTLALDSAMVFDASRRAGDRPGDAPRGHAAGQDFDLVNLDAVYLRKAPGFEPQRRVVVTGEVLFPGPYSLQKRGEKLTELVARAGGLTPEAYAEGIQLWRSAQEAGEDTLSAVQIAARAQGDTTLNLERFRQEPIPVPGDTASERKKAVADSVAQVARKAAAKAAKRTRVGFDFQRALRDPGSPHNILVLPNDSIFVPSFIQTVDVVGQVEAPTKVLYRPGAGVNYYISRAGGYTANADGGRTRVQLANGEVDTRGGKFLFFGGGITKPDPGSVITVPKKRPKEGGINFVQLATVLTSFAATIILALN